MISLIAYGLSRIATLRRFGFDSPHRPEVGCWFEMLLDLLLNSLAHDAPRDVHERIAVVGVLVHAGQAREMVVKHARLVFGLLHRATDQPVGDGLGAPARRIAPDLHIRDTPLRVDHHAELRPAEPLREIPD